MSEMLLGQHISVITWLQKEAISLHARGESYEALKTLGYITDILYDDGKDDERLKSVNMVISNISDHEATIATSDAQARDARATELRNKEASTRFRGYLREISDYMQKAGYYMKMNEGWGFFDPSKGKKDTDSWRGKKLDGTN